MGISPEDVEAKKGVYDYLVPLTGSHFSEPPPIKRRFIFCIEVSESTAENCKSS
jgi:hypothetical protein